MDVDVIIEDSDWSVLDDAEGVVQRAAGAALSGLKAPADTSVSIALAGDDAVAELNGRFRGKAGPTNVLSFPAAASAGPGFAGDVVLAFGACRSEAEADGKPLADHVSHLVVHGVLHLFGHDHDSDEDAETMEALETQVLAGLGIPDPYRPEREGGER